MNYEENPYPVELVRTAPVYGTLQCFAAHAPQLDKNFRKLIKQSIHSDTALRRLSKFIENDLALKSLVGTTQAIDLINGGVKTNALPEEAWAVVNHRIATQRYATLNGGPESVLPHRCRSTVQ